MDAFLAEAVDAHVQTRTTTYALADANRILLDMKRSNIEGTPVLAIDCINPSPPTGGDAMTLTLY